MAFFSERDRALVENLVYDPKAKPAFDILRDCLVWADERPTGVTSEGWERLQDLWVARAFLYHGRPDSDLLDMGYFRQAWEEALADRFRWPGFRRLHLSDEDRAYFESELRAERDDY